MTAADPQVLRPGLLTGRTALVTGAGTGIGRAVALRLAGLEALVVGVGRRPEPLADTAALAAPGRFVAWPLDVRRPEQATDLIAEVGRRYGLDILVNNAGGQFVAPATGISTRGFAAVTDLNLTAVTRLTESARPWLAARGHGRVVNVSLSAPEAGIPGLAHSAAARAGVLGLTRSLAQRWSADGIRLNCLAPGTVLTDGVRHELTGTALAEVLRRTPLGRATTPDEVAELVGFLAGPAGEWITGQLIALDGGATLVGAAGALLHHD
ncbi:SDR family NAD(P)-dependent oxidoreductase [Micromonospora sp. LOL_021]|uniref:SDR family NAD(P)-dependent oxidoreductase n=1 Tax=Micromonospora sp. LOL_021 TaxID=3345417 RepID=UPI003A86D1E9